ncbi:type IV pilus modification protein PilV [Rheinheimera riviphila]|uniref:Type IV pilus modification protein PilV n=2 Tax=Rheinheimera riviphila TaxID=1834037 RepID=A0A437R4R4_9GAMM|nr:type IV pilus modification protein PilV [Rheinheimera riviphila]
MMLNKRVNSTCHAGRGLQRQTGVSLLEVLIAVLVLSVGLLGIAGLQTANLRNTQSAHQRTVAVLLAASMAERIRANPVAAAAGAFALTKNCKALSAGGSIQSVEHANWMTEIRTSLGTADTSCGEVTYVVATRTYTVNVFWDDSRAIGGLANMNITHVVRI